MKEIGQSLWHIEIDIIYSDMNQPLGKICWT